MRTNQILKFIALIFSVAILSSCEYEFIEAYIPPPPNPNDTIYFQAEITPIFVSSTCTDCHKSGGLAFDLTAANAYNSITANNLVVPSEPENSKIYTFPQSGTHFASYSSNEDANLIYGWILQGALNN